MSLTECNVYYKLITNAVYNINIYLHLHIICDIHDFCYRNLGKLHSFKGEYSNEIWPHVHKYLSTIIQSLQYTKYEWYNRLVRYVWESMQVQCNHFQRSAIVTECQSSSVNTWLAVLMEKTDYCRFRVLLNLSALFSKIRPLSASVDSSSFHPLEVVSRCRDPQLHMGKN